MKNINIFRSLGLSFLALCIPAFLAVEMIQAKRYTQLDNEVRSLETLQNEAVESNKHLVTELGILSGFSRIEKIAVEELGMHQALSDEIVRIEMKNSQGENGGR